MLHLLDVADEGLNKAKEVREARRLAKPLEVLLSRFPFDAKDKAILLVNALRKLERDTVRRLSKIPGGLLVGLEECDAPVVCNAVPDVFDNHF
jgi:hypothetical protein